MYICSERPVISKIECAYSRKFTRLCVGLQEELTKTFIFIFIFLKDLFIIYLFILNLFLAALHLSCGMQDLR